MDSGGRARGRRGGDEGFASFAVVVDVVLMTIVRRELRVFLIQRGIRPKLGRWALPGRLVAPFEHLEGAAARVLAEETELAHARRGLEQLGTYGEPKHGAGRRVLTVAYWTIAPISSDAGGDPGLPDTSTAIYAEFVPVSEIESGRLRLAFDHGRIVADALAQVRSRLETTTLARRFCPPEFTISQLREVYEAVWGTQLDAANFQRRVLQNEGFLAPLEKWHRTAGSGRPARLWVAEQDGGGTLERPFPRGWREGGG